MIFVIYLPLLLIYTQVIFVCVYVCMFFGCAKKISLYLMDCFIYCWSPYWILFSSSSFLLLKITDLYDGNGFTNWINNIFFIIDLIFHSKWHSFIVDCSRSCSSLSSLSMMMVRKDENLRNCCFFLLLPHSDAFQSALIAQRSHRHLFFH